MRQRRVRETVAKLENEFGESIESIINGFADMGYSQSDTAGALDVGFNHFRRILMVHNISAKWQGYSSPFYREKVGRKTINRELAWAETVERERKRHGFWHQGVFGTMRDHCQRIGVKLSTARDRRRKQPEKGPEYWLQKDHVFRSYSNVQSNNHPWRQQKYGRLSRQSAPR